jgi:LemA protein
MIVPWVVGGVVALLVLFGVAAYNGLVRRRNHVRTAWAQVDVQLGRRHDLIPNLVGAVQGSLTYERGVLASVVRARAQALAAGNMAARAAAEDTLTGALRALFAVVEGYPQLKAGANVLALQEELASTENRIAFARQHYNDAVLEYNTARETFPRVLVAGVFGFRPAPLFGLDGTAARSAPRVQL